MKLSIGILLEDEAKEAAITAMDRMREMGTRGEYTRPDQLFIPLAQVENITDIVPLQIALGIINAYQFEITLDHIDHNGAIYWIDIENNDYFISYWRYLNERLRFAAMDTEKRNRNHIPHAVVSRKTVIPRKSTPPPVDNKSMTVKKISVMRLEYRNEMPYYTEMFCVNLPPKQKKK